MISETVNTKVELYCDVLKHRVTEGGYWLVDPTGNVTNGIVSAAAMQLFPSQMNTWPAAVALYNAVNVYNVKNLASVLRHGIWALEVAVKTGLQREFGWARLWRVNDSIEEARLFVRRTIADLVARHHDKTITIELFEGMAFLGSYSLGFVERKA